MMAEAIKFVLSHYFVLSPVAGMVWAAAEVLRRRGSPTATEPAGVFLQGFLFFGIGLSFLWNFIMHVFFGPVAARFIGWAPSPFQAEVGFASVGFAAVAMLACRGGYELRLAAIVGPACFLWGAAAGHVVQIVRAGNFAPGNAGAVLWTDLLMPVVGFVLLRWAHPRGRVGAG